MPHREAELVSSSWQYMTLKSACFEHVARGLDGRVADPADLMFRSMAKNVAGMMEIWKRARGSTARGEPKVPGAPVAWGCSALRCKVIWALQRLATSRFFGLRRLKVSVKAEAVIDHRTDTGYVIRQS